jgi:hypothetical protein
MHEPDQSTNPTQLAIATALCLYVDGGKRADTRQMRTSLSALRHTTREQVRAAMPSVATNQSMTRIEIQAMFAIPLSRARQFTRSGVQPTE